MAKPIEPQAIETIVRRASLRLRTQRAFEVAATSLFLAAAVGLVVVLMVRLDHLSETTGAWALLACPLVVLAGAGLGFRHREADELVARRVDRASGLADRLSTALTFSRMLERGELAEGEDPDTTQALMRAAIADGNAATARARVEAATPFSWPKDLRAAAGFLALCALVAGIALPPSSSPPRLLSARPDHAPPGAEVALLGANLLTGATLAAPGAAPANGAVFLGEGASARPMQILRWTDRELLVTVPDEAPVGQTLVTAYLGARAIGPLHFVVVDAKDKRFHKDDAVALEDPELEYLRALLSDIRMTAKQDQAEALEEYAAKIEKLLEQAERGELTKEQLLREMEKAQAEMDGGAEPQQADLDEQLAETGKELAKNELTKELGQALQKSDLTEAQKQLEKLADKLDKQELSKQEQEKLAKTLDKVAKQFEQRQQEQSAREDKQKKDLEEQVRRLEKEKQEAKSDRERQDAERRLEKKKEELARLEKKQQERQESMQREAVKRLHKDMEQAAEDLQRQDQDQDQQQQQASRNLKDAARETGRVDQEQRKQAAQRKVATQMEDLKEAMRRAKQKGQKGPQNPFGKDRKQSDFAARARGQQGNRTAWKPGQGKQPGQGQQGQQGQGQGPGQGQQGQGQKGDTWGDGHDDNLVGDPTEKGGHTKDEQLQGVQGKGPSRRQTILAAAQKGFANAKYQEVYTDYKRIVEEVMRSEKVPSSYKYYVKRYFNQIKPKTEP